VLWTPWADFLPRRHGRDGLARAGLGAGGVLEGFGHGFLEAIFAGPVEADFVAVGIVDVSVAPTPGHRGRRLGEIEILLLEPAAEIVEIGDFEIEADAIAGNGIAGTRLMQSDGAFAAGSALAGIDGAALETKIFDEFEAEHVGVEAERALDVSYIDHGVIEGELSVGHGGSGGAARFRAGGV
jgi:hypothetical protein